MINEKIKIKKIIDQLYLRFDYPIREVIKSSGISRNTVSKFFNFKRISPSSMKKIYESCLDLIDQQQQEELSLLERHKYIDLQQHIIDYNDKNTHV